MLKIFDQGIDIVILSTILFFIVLWFLSYGWSRPNHNKGTTYVVSFLVSAMYTFKFLIRSFLIILVFSIIWQLGEYLISSSFIPSF
jgi:hypothetical protein